MGPTEQTISGQVLVSPELDNKSAVEADTLVKEILIDGMCGVYEARPMETFDLDRGWDIHPKVSVRPEPFGALLYHFGTRRLSSLKDRTPLAVVQSLFPVSHCPGGMRRCRDW
jgi:mycofactocin precursor